MHCISPKNDHSHVSEAIGFIPSVWVVPSGNLLHSYWKWPSRNSGFTQLKNGDFPVRYVTVYQRVTIKIWMVTIAHLHKTRHRARHSQAVAPQEDEACSACAVEPHWKGMVETPPRKMVILGMNMGLTTWYGLKTTSVYQLVERFFTRKIGKWQMSLC